MPTRRAVANGNWSSTSTWNGGIVPTDGDTVYSNGFNITLDVDVLIGGANNPIVNTGSLVSGQWYEIVNVGGQNWTNIGAASNTTGTVFLATGTGTAGNSGTARALATITTASNTAAGATTGGGAFLMSTVRQFNASVRAGTTICLDYTATGTFTIDGLQIVGGSATNAFGIRNNSTGTISCSNCSLIPGGGTQSDPICNNSTGVVSVSGSTMTGGNSNSPAGSGIRNAAAGTVNITSSTLNGGGVGNGYAAQNSSTGSMTIASSTINGASAPAAFNAATGTMTITSSTLAGGTVANSQSVSNSSTGTLVCTSCTFTASAFTNAVNISNTGADVRLSGDFLDHWSGWRAVNGGRWRLGTTPSAARTRYALAGTTDSYVEMFTADNATFGQPAISNVRAGVVYGGGILTGTCAVPAAGSVALGVPVDNTTGTAILTQANVQSAVWAAATSSLTTAGSIGERLKNAATVATTGEQLATALTAP